MKKIFKFLPVYGIIPLICAALTQITCYLSTSAISADFVKHDLTTVFDFYVPFSAWWILIYYFWFLFLAFYYIVIDVYSKKAVYRVVAVELISFVILFIFFLAYPTTNVRLPEYREDGFFGALVANLYRMDRPTNLFPSMHVYASWLCFVIVRREKKIPLWLRILSLNLAILIIISTQTLKQHYVLDIVSAILYAEVMNLLVGLFKLDRYFERFFTFINVKLKIEPEEEYEKFRKPKVRDKNKI